MNISFKSDALKFVKTLDPKHAKQLFVKTLELCNNPMPQDCKMLQGNLKGKYRVDSGEYRIVYEIDADLIRIIVIGKRNDDEVYKLAERK